MHPCDVVAEKFQSLAPQRLSIHARIRAQTSFCFDLPTSSLFRDGGADDPGPCQFCTDEERGKDRSQLAGYSPFLSTARTRVILQFSNRVVNKQLCAVANADMLHDKGLG